MELLKFIFVWARRLPWRFSLPFLASMFLYPFVVLFFLTPQRLDLLSVYLLALIGVPERVRALPQVMFFWKGIVVVFLFLIGILISYNLAGWIYRWARKRPSVGIQGPTQDMPGEGTRLNAFEKVGIILAGGGAKGAYQAGAMKAIYEFLEQNNALHKVRMIAGTSIGSWNAMFWLAGMVKPPAPGGRSAHEEWWRTINISQIVEFAPYVPLWHNRFLFVTPWRETFRQLFVETAESRSRLARLFVPAGSAENPPIHYYFTRSNVERGYLEFSTNWPGIQSLTRPNLRTADPSDTEPIARCDTYEIITGGEQIRDALGRTERAVFASMDLPPLFPYARLQGNMEKWFEDGGVVDNLPVWFGTQVEQCDLLIILPLNASFAEPVNFTSITKRLFRVMDVRQGVLERNSLKLAYLYNELAALRTAVETQQGEPPNPQRRAVSDLETRALRRQHKPVSVFAICPAQPLAIGTAEFWKTQEAGKAFELMYAATRCELEERFEEDTDPDHIRMTLVSPYGERTYVDEF